MFARQKNRTPTPAISTPEQSAATPGLDGAELGLDGELDPGLLGNGFVAQLASAAAPPDDGDLPFRGAMEGLLGEDFSDVEVHTGASEIEALGANALAKGDEIWFAEADPDPETVAHELAHVVQQREGGEPAQDGLTGPEHPAEREASAISEAVTSGSPAQATASPGPGLHREASAPTQASSEAADTGAAITEQGAAPAAPGDLGAIAIEWDPPALEAEHMGLSVGLDFEASARFEPVADPDDPTKILLSSDLSASASGTSELAVSKSFEHGPAAPTNALEKHGMMETRGEAEIGASASFGAQANAGFSATTRHDLVAWQKAKQAIEDVPKILHVVNEALADLEDLGKELEQLKGVLADEKATIEDALNEAADAAGKAAELVGDFLHLKYLIESILDVALGVAQGALDFVHMIAGDAGQAKDLETGEGFQLVLGGSVEAGGSLSASGQVQGPLSNDESVIPDPSDPTRGLKTPYDEIKVEAGHEQSASRSYSRVFDVQGTEWEMGERTVDGVEITVTFVDEKKAEEMSGGSKGPHSLGHSNEDSLASSHELTVRLADDMPNFEVLYDKVFSASTPDELLKLTHEKGLRYSTENGAGLITLAMTTDYSGEQLTSTFLGDSDTHGLFAGGSEGASSSQVVINYQEGKLDVANVDASGQSQTMLNLDNAAMHALGDGLNELLGVNPLEALPDNLQLTNEQVAWSYDGKAASIKGESGTTDKVLRETWLSPKDLRELMMRAADPSWYAAGADARVDDEFLDDWMRLSADLRHALSRGTRRAFDIAGKSLSLQVVDAAGNALTAQQPDGTVAPFIPKTAEAEWTGFLCAEIVGMFIAQATKEYGAEDVRQAIDNARGMFFGDMDNTNEIGLEVEGGYQRKDGRVIGRGDFQVMADEARAIEDELSAAAAAAHEEQLGQLRKQQATDAAKSDEVDQALVTKAKTQIDELNFVVEQIRDTDATDMDNGYAAIGMLAFLQRPTTRLTLAVADYLSAFGKGAMKSGYAVRDPETGEEISFEEQTIEFVDPSMRDAMKETLARQAVVVAIDLEDVKDEVEGLIGMLEAVPESEMEAFADQQKIIQKCFARWDGLWLDFKELRKRGAERLPAKDLDCDDETWDAAHEGPNELIDRYHESFRYRWKGDREPLYMRKRGDFVLGEGAAPEGELPPPDILASDELFDFNKPEPAIGRHDYRKLDAAGKERTGKTLPSDSKDWGLKADGRRKVLEWAGRVAWALTYQPEEVQGSVWTIEGHTDERDSDEYNLHLGYRRAMALRQLMIDFGVPPALLTVRSKGRSELIHADVEDRFEAGEFDEPSAAPEGVDPVAWQACRTPEERKELLHQLNRRVGLHDETSWDTAMDESIGATEDTTAPALGGVVRRHLSFEQGVTLRVLYDLFGGSARKVITFVHGQGGDLAAALADAAADAERAKDDPELVEVFQNGNAGGADPVSFQPPRLDRLDRHNCRLTAVLRRVGGLEPSFFGGTSWRYVSRAVDHLVDSGQLHIGFEVAGRGPAERFVADQTQFGVHNVILDIVAPTEAAADVMARFDRDLRVNLVVQRAPLTRRFGKAEGEAATPDRSDEIAREIASQKLTWTARPRGLWTKAKVRFECDAHPERIWTSLAIDEEGMRERFDALWDERLAESYAAMGFVFEGHALDVSEHVAITHARGTASIDMLELFAAHWRERTGEELALDLWEEELGLIRLPSELAAQGQKEAWTRFHEWLQGNPTFDGAS